MIQYSWALNKISMEKLDFPFLRRKMLEKIPRTIKNTNLMPEKKLDIIIVAFLNISAWIRWTFVLTKMCCVWSKYALNITTDYWN